MPINKVILVLVTLSLAFSTCEQRPGNKKPDVEVDMRGNGPQVLEGKRTVTFDMLNDKYKMLKPGFEKGLISDWEVLAPSDLTITAGEATIKPTTIEYRRDEGNRIVTTLSGGYELKVKLTVELVPTKAKSTTYDVIVRFPAILTVVKAIELPLAERARAPEIHFRILHHQKPAAN